MRSEFDEELADRLMRYAAIDTRSDEASPSAPSTERQIDLLRLLERERAPVIRLTLSVPRVQEAEPGDVENPDHDPRGSRDQKDLQHRVPGARDRREQPRTGESRRLRPARGRRMGSRYWKPIWP
mgnify:CR=1 FL=1